MQVLLTALVIVADWIASNADLFPYFPHGVATDPERIDTAWKQLDLPHPWQAVEPEEDPATLFATRFDLPKGARIRPVQEEAVRLARALPAPGMMIIEAPMGEGKTEAALAVTEIFAARSGAGGCFIALPTMATGNAMFPRMLHWLKRLPNKAGTHSVFLAHSKAALNEEYTDAGPPGQWTDHATSTATAQKRNGSPAAMNRRGPGGCQLVAHHVAARPEERQCCPRS